MERDPYDDIDPESIRELIDLGPVEVAPGFRVEIGPCRPTGLAIGVASRFA
jgi:hypothetical protein